MQIVDLRQVRARALENLFEEEISRWREELHWDYRPSIELIRRFIDSRSLGGCVATDNGHAAGYGFYVLEDHKGLIGGLFVSAGADQANVTQLLLRDILGALRSTPRLQRIEAQLMPFGSEIDSACLSPDFRLHTRQFMLLPLRDAQLNRPPVSAGMRIEPWTDRMFEPAARLIHLAYADHVDAEINDQYRSEAGGMKFLRNIVLLPGCGQFLPDASFVVRPVGEERLVGMVLTSTVADRVGHTTQLCVMPGYQGHHIGRQLMERSIDTLKQRHYESLSLTVTATNQRAVKLYESLGFHAIKKFAAGVWRA